MIHVILVMVYLLHVHRIELYMWSQLSHRTINWFLKFFKFYEFHKLMNALIGDTLRMGTGIFFLLLLILCVLCPQVKCNFLRGKIVIISLSNLLSISMTEK